MGQVKKLANKLWMGFLAALIVTGCGTNVTSEDSVIRDAKAEYPNAQVISLLESQAKLDDKEITSYDYTWHCDPTEVHDDVDGAPAEYYTGTKPIGEDAVYIDQELYYYPKLAEDKFTKVNYDGEQEWAYYYEDGENDAYIFGTLPNLGGQMQTSMMHTEEEASENKVLHINAPGEYILSGTWSGQVKVDLGEDSYDDPEKKVTLILCNASIECSVAPGVVFYRVYEADNKWEERETSTKDVELNDFGATIVLADNSENHISGTNVFRMLKPKYKDEESKDEIKVQKKMRKTDGALYSYMSMQIKDGESHTGKLIVDGGFEGIDSELHLVMSGGDIIVNSQDDGINVNEDNTSCVWFTDGTVTINAAQGAEGDGVDSNGFIVVNGGNVFVNGVRPPDSALDSEDGVTYLSGTITIDGQKQSYKEGDEFKETGKMGDGPGGMPFDGKDSTPKQGGPFGDMGQNFDLSKFKEDVANLPDDATFEDVLQLLGMNREPKDMGQGQEPPK